MFLRFQKILTQNDWTRKKILLALSGGVDSMVLADLLRRSGMEFRVAHVNYQLRGEASDQDEEMVRSWAARHQVVSYLKKFDLGRQLEREGGNLQETARDIRYQWLEELCGEIGFDLIATAHHRDDSVETMLMHFFKGTGIAGLHGILPVQGKVVRPLIDFSKDDLEEYAEAQKVPWRLDASNLELDYLRNVIRNKMIPLLEKELPGLKRNLASNIRRFQEVEQIYQEGIERYRKQLLQARGNDWVIPVRKLEKLPSVQTIAYELLKDFGFRATQIPEALRLLGSESGKRVESKSHLLIKDRNHFVLTKKTDKSATFFLIDAFEGTRQLHFPLGRLDLALGGRPGEEEWRRIRKAGADEVFLDAGKLQFPLVLRLRREGDYFYPFGAGAKKKKVSRFLVDQKVGAAQRANIWVVESNKKIVWVVGQRGDDRFQIRAQTQSVLSLRLKPEIAGAE